jgi:putative transposase
MKALAVEYPRYGYQILYNLLKGEGLVVNKKRTYRLCTEESLQVRTKKRKKLQRPRLPMEVSLARNKHLQKSYILTLFACLANPGKSIRILNIADDHSK